MVKYLTIQGRTRLKKTTGFLNPIKRKFLETTQKSTTIILLHEPNTD